MLFLIFARQAHRCRTSDLGRDRPRLKQSTIVRLSLSSSNLQSCTGWLWAARSAALTAAELPSLLWKTWIRLPQFGRKNFDHFRIKKDRTTKPVMENVTAARVVPKPSALKGMTASGNSTASPSSFSLGESDQPQGRQKTPEGLCHSISSERGVTGENTREARPRPICLNQDHDSSKKPRARYAH